MDPLNQIRWSRSVKRVSGLHRARNPPAREVPVSHTSSGAMISPANRAAKHEFSCEIATLSLNLFCCAIDRKLVYSRGCEGNAMTRRTVIQLGGAPAASLASLACRVAVRGEPRLRLLRQHETPVLTKRHPDAAGIKYGFEGGRVVKLGSTYHLFTSEMAGDPIWVKMQLGYWRSGDGVRWKRIGTLFSSSGEFEGNDPPASLWSPLPVFYAKEGRCNRFYVAYRAAP